MSNFGDYDDDDALDTAVADPEQVAIKLQSLRLRHRIEMVAWADLTQIEREERIEVIIALFAWLRRQGAWI